MGDIQLIMRKFAHTQHNKNISMGKVLLILIVAVVVVASCTHRKKTVLAKETAAAEHGNDNKGETVIESNVVYLTTDDFKHKVMNYDEHPQEWVFEGKRPAVVDFYATWCGPCKMTAPILEKLAVEYKGKVDFYKVDIDRERELAETFGIQSIPTFLFIPAKGKPTFQMGAMQKRDFEEIIDTELLNQK